MMLKVASAIFSASHRKTHFCDDALLDQESEVGGIVVIWYRNAQTGASDNPLDVHGKTLQGSLEAVSTLL